MAVRVEVKIQRINKNQNVESVALLNSGFEADSPQILLPSKVASMLGFLPDLPTEAISETFEGIGGLKKTKMYIIPDAVKVNVVCKDRKCKPVKCSIVISEAEKEVIINDKLIEKLNLVIENAGKGLWCFKDDRKKRKYLAVRYWS